MDIFYALSEPRRRNILEVIAHTGQMSAQDIFKKFNISFPAISQHLKVLREANLVNVEKRAQKRLYSINQTKIEELEHWAQELTQIWESRFDALDKLLEEEKKKQFKSSNVQTFQSE